MSLCRKHLAVLSLTLQPSGHYMYRTVVTICTASLTLNSSTFCPHSAFVCFVWISEQTVIISLYNINWLVCITETECVYCAVRAGCLSTVSGYMFHIRALENICTVRTPTIAHSYNMICLILMFSYMFVSPFRPASWCCAVVLMKYDWCTNCTVANM